MHLDLKTSFNQMEISIFPHRNSMVENGNFQKKIQ